MTIQETINYNLEHAQRFMAEAMEMRARIATMAPSMERDVLVSGINDRDKEVVKLMSKVVELNEKVGM